MKLAAYVRVSTDRQAEKGLGLVVQRETIAAWAKANSHEIIVVYADEGVSGSNGLDTREGLLDALGALKRREVDGLVVYRLDRLARDLILQEQLLAEVKRMGGQLFSTSDGEAAYLSDDVDDPSRKLIRQLIGAVNEYERAIIRLRLRNGKKAKAARGGYVGGVLPFGKSNEDREFVLVASEMAVIARAKALRAEGLSLPVICQRLTNEGHKPKHGGTWYPTTVARIVGPSRKRRSSEEGCEAKPLPVPSGSDSLGRESST